MLLSEGLQQYPSQIRVRGELELPPEMSALALLPSRANERDETVEQQITLQSLNHWLTAGRAVVVSGYHQALPTSPRIDDQAEQPDRSASEAPTSKSLRPDSLGDPSGDPNASAHGFSVDTVVVLPAESS